MSFLALDFWKTIIELDRILDTDFHFRRDTFFVNDFEKNFSAENNTYEFSFNLMYHSRVLFRVKNA